MSNGYGSGGVDTPGIGKRRLVSRQRYKITQVKKKRIFKEIQKLYRIMRYKMSYRRNILFFWDYYHI